MDCKKVSSVIVTDYIDENMKGLDLDALEAHIRSCPNCHTLAERVARLRTTFKAAPVLEAPPSLWKKIRDEVTIDPVRIRYRMGLLGRIRERLALHRPAVIITCTVVLLICIVTAVRFMPIFGSSSAGISQDELITIASMNGASEESEYDLGTGAEQYFL